MIEVSLQSKVRQIVSCGSLIPLSHQADSGQFWESLDGLYWYRLVGDDLSMATSAHRKNGNCTYNLSRYLHRFKSIDL